MSSPPPYLAPIAPIRDWHRWLEIIRDAVEDPDIFDTPEDDARRKSAWSGDYGILQGLEAFNAAGETPLAAAVRKEWWASVALLLEHGAALPFAGGPTPLDCLVGGLLKTPNRGVDEAKRLDWLEACASRLSPEDLASLWSPAYAPHVHSALGGTLPLWHLLDRWGIPWTADRGASPTWWQVAKEQTQQLRTKPSFLEPDALQQWFDARNTMLNVIALRQALPEEGDVAARRRPRL